MSARLALLIAASEYQDPGLGRLRSPVHDVTELARLLASPEVGGYRVEKLVNSPDAEVRRRLGRFLRTARATDMLLIHFACHGFVDMAGELYLTARDTELADVAVTALSAGLLSRLIDRSPSRRVLLILDCCFSGAISRVMTHRGGSGLPLGEAFRGEGEGRAVLTASRAEEYAYEPSGELLTVNENPMHSVFADALLEGLRTGDADLDGDGEISVNDLYRYVYRRVLDTGSAQTPSQWNFVQGTMFVAHRVSGRISALVVSAAGLPAAPRTPWDADLLDWRFPQTAEFTRFLDGRHLSPEENQAWRIVTNGEWERATTAFDVVAGGRAADGTSWWGQALCHAVAGRWRQAGATFEQAADALNGVAPAVGGAALLAAVCFAAASHPRSAELLEEMADLAVFAPELAAYRALRSSEDAGLSRALRLEPGLTVALEEVGADVRAVLAEAVREEEERLALLSRARLRLSTLGLTEASGRCAVSATSLSGRDGERRLRDCQKLVAAERAQLIDGIAGLDERIDGLLAAPGGRGVLAEVAALREAEAGAVEALRRTDQPAPIRLIGLPPRGRR